MTFIDRLLMLMKNKKITAYRLAKEIGISESVISKWQKTPDTEPSSTVLYKISEYFQVSMKWLLVGEDEPIKNLKISEAEPHMSDFFSLEEKLLLEQFRDLSETGQDEILGRAARLANKSKTEKTKVIKEKVKEKNVVKIVTEPETIFNEESPQKEMMVFDLPASAGLGNYLCDDHPQYEMLSFDEDEVPYRADFGVRITGDSMEPKISDGDIVWVKEQIQIESGEIGIFVLNDDAYCKKLRIDYDKYDRVSKVWLVSVNPKYKPIEITEYDVIRTVGKVIF